jgi:hypothetical protein
MCNRKIQIKEKYSHYEIRICHCKKWEDGCFEELLAMNQLQYIPGEKCFIFSKCHLDLVLYLLGHLEITYQIEEEYLYFDQDKAASSKPKDFDKGKWVSKTKNLVNVSPMDEEYHNYKVEFSYNTVVLEIIKEIKGRRYFHVNGKSYWTVPNEKVHQFLFKLQANSIGYNFQNSFDTI